MSRLRVTLTTAALLVALAALTLNSVAQPPDRGGGGPGGRGFGGPGGWGGPGGRGGPGGPGGSLLQLASNEAVQVELKVKDKQKTQIKSLNDRYNAQMQEYRAQMGGPGGPGGGGPQGRGRGGNGDPNAQGGGGGGGFGGGGQENAQGGGGRGNRGRNQNNGGVPEDPEVAQQRAEQRAAAREAMDQLRLTAESSLGKILDKAQVTRLKQIDLQRQGPDVVFREDMIEKLGIDEAQVEMLNEVRGGRRTAQRATQRARGELMKAAFQSINPQPANDAGDDGNGGNGQNGNRRRGGFFDPAQREAFQKYMERPEVKAQGDELKAQEDKLQAQYVTEINKVLTSRQRAILKKMLGVPFDLSKLGGPGGNPWGRRGGGPGGAAATKDGSNATKSAPTAKASGDDNGDDESPKAKASSPASTVAKPAAAPKRKSLRELRGAPTDDN